MNLIYRKSVLLNLKNILKNRESIASIFSMLNIFIKMMVSLLTVPLTIQIFGDEMYGIWAAALSIMTFVNFLDAGLTPSILNKLSITFTKKDSEGFRKAYILGVYVGISVILISIIGSMFLKYIDLKLILNWSDNIDSDQVLSLFRVVLITTGFIIGTSIFENVFFSIQKGYIPRIASIISNIIGLILIIIVSNQDISIIELALVIQMPKFVYRIFLLLIIESKNKISILPFIKFEKQYLKELLNVSTLFIFIQIFQWIYSSAASIIIPKFIGLIEYSEFSIQFMPFNVILTIVAAMQPIFWPKLIELYSRKERRLLSDKLNKLIKASSLFIIIFMIIYIVLGPLFIKIYSKNTVVFEYSLAINLFLWLLIQSIVWWFSTFLHGLEDLKFEIISFGMSGIGLVSISCLLGNSLNLEIYTMLMWLSILIFNLIPMYIRVKKFIREV